MITIRPLSRLAQVSGCFILFASFALAALQNVTVDDAVLIGAAVPTYLPSPSSWNQGNICSGCLVRPNPSMAYNGTWHDTTFSPNSTVSQAFEFTFVGAFPDLSFEVLTPNTLNDRKCIIYIFHPRKQRALCHYVHICELHFRWCPNIIIFTHPFDGHRLRV